MIKNAPWELGPGGGGGSNNQLIKQKHEFPVRLDGKCQLWGCQSPGFWPGPGIIDCST